MGRAREHEPARGISREDEPRMSPCFREENEPSKERNADDDEAELAGWLCCGRPVGDDGLVAGQLPTSSESFWLVREDQNDEHHCPWGCPGIGSAGGSVGAMECVEDVWKRRVLRNWQLFEFRVVPKVWTFGKNLDISHPPTSGRIVG